MRRLARFVLGLLYRDIEIVGAEHLPKTGAAIVIANHGNSLVDGGLLLGFLPRIPRFLAASTVWDYKPVAPFMDASGSVKVFRQQDGRAHEGSLEDSFADAAALLADGGVLAIFPEGRTHDGSGLLPFKTGTARIVDFTKQRHPGLDLAIVPVGVDYEVKSAFRSRVTFTFGAPLAPGRVPVRDGSGAEDANGTNGAFRAESGRLQAALSAVAPDFSDAREARAARLGGEILALEAGGGGSPRGPLFSRVVAGQRAVRAAFDGGETEMQREADDPAAPGAVAEARAALAAYGAALDHAGLTDHEVAAPRGVRLSDAVGVVLCLPLLLVAFVFNLPQALLLRAVSRTKPRDRQLTWITFGGLVVYPASWILWAVVLGLVAGATLGAGWGWAVALAVLVGAPVSGRLALPWIDRGARIVRAIRVRRHLSRAPELGPRLAALRSTARQGLGALGLRSEANRPQ